MRLGGAGLFIASTNTCRMNVPILARTKAEN